MEYLEFGTAYSAVTGDLTGDYVPYVEHDESHDILIDGHDGDTSEWRAIIGKTGQYGYRGAVMHPSEYASDDMIRAWVQEAGGDVFAVVAVEAPCTEDEPCFDDLGRVWCEDNGCDAPPAGWAVIYRAR